MKKNPYLPKREGDRVTWLNNFAVKLGVYASRFGIAPAIVTAVVAYAASYAYIINFIEQIKVFKKDAVGFKNRLTFAAPGTILGTIPTFTPGAAPPTTTPGIFTIVAGIAKGIKSQINLYTEDIGNDMGIVGDDFIFNPDDYTTVLAITKKVDGIQIDFVKGEADGEHIYSRLNRTGEFTYLASDTESPYMDTRALAVAGTPEVREYYAIGFLHDHEIGHPSAIVTVTVGPVAGV